MDDEKFKKELLNRLDKIVALLSISCAISNGSIEKQRADSAIRQIMSSKSGAHPEPTPPSINDEMEEIHSIALKRWQSERSGKDEEQFGANVESWQTAARG